MSRKLIVLSFVSVLYIASIPMAFGMNEELQNELQEVQIWGLRSLTPYTPSENFLKNMRGIPTTSNSTPLEGELTYTRQYFPNEETDTLRKMVGQSTENIGQWYETKGGRFSSEDIQENDTSLTPSQYAIKHSNFQIISDVPIEDILKQSKAYGINYIIDRYYEPTQIPQEGDLAVYITEDSPHYSNGFLEQRKDEEKGIGVLSIHDDKHLITSKRYTGIKKIFSHEPFFVPESDGNEIFYYTPRKTPKIIPQPIFSFSKTPTGTFNENGYFVFDQTEENIQLRNEYETGERSIYRIEPHISMQFGGGCLGNCQAYALGKCFKTYDLPSFNWEDYSVKFTDPKEGDLVVYSGAHFGIYLGNGIVESKFSGFEGIYVHPLFHSSLVGNALRFFRLTNFDFSNPPLPSEDDLWSL